MMLNEKEKVIEINELIKKRWSPRSFSGKEIEPEKIEALFEAARLSPSSYNAQPWRFIYASKPSRNYYKILESLTDKNKEWASQAPLLIAAVTKKYLDNGKENKHAFYDLGQAVAALSLQATAMDLFVHQMGGFTADIISENYSLPEGFIPASIIAVGYIDEKIHERAKIRKDVDEIAGNELIN